MNPDFEHVRTESRLLGEELKRRSDHSQQLQQQAASLKKDIAETRSRLTENLNRSTELRKGSIIQFPKTEFTIEQLERANAAVHSADVRLELARAVAVGRVDFFRSNGAPESASTNGEIQERFGYRVASQTDPTRHAA